MAGGKNDQREKNQISLIGYEPTPHLTTTHKKHRAGG